MKTKQAILLGIFFVVIVTGTTFVANARSRQARAQAEQARATAMQAMQEQQRLKNQSPASPAK